MQKTKMISRAHARRELIEKSHLNTIQIDKVLGGREEIPQHIVDTVLKISDDAEKEARLPNLTLSVTREAKTKDGLTVKGSKARVVGSNANRKRASSVGGDRQPMNLAIERAIKFVDEKALK